MHSLSCWSFLLLPSPPLLPASLAELQCSCPVPLSTAPLSGVYQHQETCAPSPPPPPHAPTILAELVIPSPPHTLQLATSLSLSLPHNLPLVPSQSTQEMWITSLKFSAASLAKLPPSLPSPPLPSLLTRGVGCTAAQGLPTVISESLCIVLVVVHVSE